MSPKSPPPAQPFYFILLIFYFFFTIDATWSQNRPNILFILTDDLGYTDLGVYGNPYNETPNIDAIGTEGIIFQSAYSASPVCSPSRAAIMTGKHPARLGITNFLIGERKDETSTIDPPTNWQKFLPSEEITLAEKLKEFGYNTGFVGKWHLNGRGESQEGTLPWDQGFDYSRMITKNGLDYYHYGIALDGLDKEFMDNGTEYLTDKLTGYALEYLKDQKNSSDPFFLYLSYSAPHVFLVPRGDKLKKYFLKYEEYDGYYNPNYAAMIESVDDGVGALIAYLESEQLLENTLVIFTSDNGGVGLPELGPIPTNQYPLKKWKGHNYEGGNRIPAIFYWKGVLDGGKSVEEYFMNTDYFATILNILDMKTTFYEDGKSILPLLEADGSFDRGPIYWHYPHFSNQMGRPSAAIRDGDWKLIYFFESDAVELYNIRESIKEENNLATVHLDKSQELKFKLTQWLKTIDAPMPVWK